MAITHLWQNEGCMLMQIKILLKSSLFALTGLDVKERLARQQELLRKRLGMVPGLETGMDILLEDEDILPSHVGTKKTLEKQKSKESQVRVTMS